MTMAPDLQDATAMVIEEAIAAYRAGGPFACLPGLHCGSRQPWAAVRLPIEGCPLRRPSLLPCPRADI